jgi:hypothetical protein
MVQNQSDWERAKDRVAPSPVHLQEVAAKKLCRSFSQETFDSFSGFSPRFKILSPSSKDGIILV